jgi:hypothetical protein
MDQGDVIVVLDGLDDAAQQADVWKSESEDRRQVPPTPETPEDDEE